MQKSPKILTRSRSKFFRVLFSQLLTRNKRIVVFQVDGQVPLSEGYLLMHILLESESI
jgi:hypothetical protein